MTEAPKKQSSLPESKDQEVPPPGRRRAPNEPSIREPSISEQPIMEDGQLGAGNLERGPERRNPEGSSGIPNPPRESR